jgi:hypothetical protein
MSGDKLIAVDIGNSLTGSTTPPLVRSPCLNPLRSSGFSPASRRRSSCSPN